MQPHCRCQKISVLMSVHLKTARTTEQAVNKTVLKLSKAVCEYKLININEAFIMKIT